MSLKQFLNVMPRHEVSIEYGGKEWKLWVREPSTAEFSEKLANQKNTVMVATLVYQNRDDETPFFTEEEISGLPTALSGLLVDAVQGVLSSAYKKKSDARD